MFSERFENSSDELTKAVNNDFITAKKEKRESIDSKQEAKELIKAEVEISPENFGDLRQAEAWLERVSNVVAEMTAGNFKQNSEEPQIDQHEFDQYYLDIIAAYNDRDYKEVKTQIKKIKEFLKQLAGNENIGENKKE